jgi:hypothetical protein
MAARNANPIAVNHLEERWLKTPLEPTLARELALLETATQGLAAVTRLLAGHLTEREIVDTGSSPDRTNGALSSPDEAGLAAAASALARCADTHLSRLCDRLMFDAPRDLATMPAGAPASVQ